MALAFVFPGQGSQSVGMLADLADQSEVRETFDEASGVLGYDLWKLIQEGPESELNATERTQPALLTAAIGLWRAWEAQGGARPDYLAGHSLGEYSALVAAGAIAFRDAVSLVEFRGQAMQQAVPAGTGAMAAILGLDDKAVAEVCDAARDGDVVEAVNFNSPGQVVIAGHCGAVERAVEKARESGARRALILPVSVPSHCELMRPAAERMAERLADVEIGRPAIPVLHNVDVKLHDGAEEIREALVAQLYCPVRWVETIRALADEGVDRLVECGPGKVLAGLNRRIERDMAVAAIFDSASLEKALEA
ncbi:MAG: ACP S-malonyltransferase [Gammaproteobacteria bacterium]|jgi:[acyl-carrier-protein] S-malonyltransferase